MKGAFGPCHALARAEANAVWSFIQEISFHPVHRLFNRKKSYSLSWRCFNEVSSLHSTAHSHSLFITSTSNQKNTFLPLNHQLYFTPLYSTLLYSNLLYSTLLYFTLLYFTLLYSTLLYSNLLYSTLLYFTLLRFTLLYFTLLQYNLLYFTPIYFAFCWWLNLLV